MGLTVKNVSMIRTVGERWKGGKTMTKVETKNRKKNSEEAEEFELHGGSEHFKGCPACQGVTDEHSYGPGCRLKKKEI